MASIVGPVIYAIYINGVASKEFPLDVELRQCWGQHDTFYIRIEYQKMLVLNNKTLWADNAPIQIIWGQAPSNVQTWYGYVNHHTIDSNSDSGSKVMQITYTCIGMSKPMNTDQTRTWGEVTGTYMAKKIAAEYGLRAVLSSTDWVHDYEVQSNESDFKFLNRMADKVGYRFWVSNGTLYFMDPIAIIEGVSGTQSAPKFYMDKSFLYLDTIVDFHMDEGDNIPGAAQTVRQMYGVDKATGNVFQVTAQNATVTGTLSQIDSEWPVNTVNEAQNLVNAWQSRSQFWMAATAELYGTSSLYPGKLVYLTGNQLNESAQGYWIVASADHVMRSSGTPDPTKDRYTTRVQLVKNESATLPKIRGLNKIAPEFVTCNLLNGIWRATTQTVIYDGITS
jgi:hypothetical protein